MGVNEGKLFTYINNNKIDLDLPKDFTIFDYTKHNLKYQIKITYKYQI